MTIVVTTPTGNIGRSVAERLLQAGKDVVVVARDPGRVAQLSAAGARVVQGSHSDADVMKRATEGAEALFFLTPPDMMTDDVRAHAAKFGEPVAAAVETNAIPYVLYNSGQGTDYADHNAQPLHSLRDNEQRMAAVAKNLVCGRPSFFMENLLGQIDGLRHRWRYWPSWAGLIFTSFHGDTPIPMIATPDIGDRYAEILGNLDWSGHVIEELHGPGEISHDEIAQVLGEVLSRQVAHLRVTKEQMIGAMVGAGMCSAHMAEGFYDMGVELEAGRMAFRDPRSERNTSSTTFRQFAETVFKPVLESVS